MPCAHWNGARGVQNLVVVFSFGVALAAPTAPRRRIIIMTIKIVISVRADEYANSDDDDEDEDLRLLIQ